MPCGAQISFYAMNMYYHILFIKKVLSYLKRDKT